MTILKPSSDSPCRVTRGAGPLTTFPTVLLLLASFASAASPDPAATALIPDFENGFTVADSGHGWSYSFEYPPSVPGLEFLWLDVFEDMESTRTSFGIQADSALPDGELESWESWIIEGGMGLLPSPEGMATVISEYWWFTGGAHGLNNTILYRYALEGAPEAEEWVEIDSRDLLADSAELVRFSAIVCDTLEVRLGPDPDKEWILRGAGPYWENYSMLCPVPDSSGALAGYTVIFPEYGVGPYCFGQQEVFVPLDLLRP